MTNKITTPSFVIIGAMKCATTTLYEQLKKQPGIFMPDLKEPNFFSDEEQYSKGLEWYSNLFEGASLNDLLGEASTHYTKSRTYPNTISRIEDCLTNPKFIYVIRNPIDRLISQYIHEWTEGKIKVDINEAIKKHPELIEYSCYAKQIAPYTKSYGKESILLVSFEDIKNSPQSVLNNICNFIGYKGKPKWFNELEASNVSKERIRRFPLFKLLIESSLATFIRRTFIPNSIRNKIKLNFQMRERPILHPASIEFLNNIFNDEKEIIKEKFGIELS
jgi:hypothetical protein